MQFSTIPRAGLGLFLVLLSFAASLVSAHSWVESVYKVDPATRKFFGAPGFPRGGSFRRMSMPVEQGGIGLGDGDYILRLPVDGIWTGEENINKDPTSLSGPEDEILEVAPGDFIAIQHLENGHVSTVPEYRALNGGTVFIYGTSEPKDEEKIFDMHLKWNEDGTGGDKRGRLLATRNFDDKQCYEGGGTASSRAADLGSDAAMSLPCQSDIQLPDDLKPGSMYTIYWYWDWPNFNIEAMDMEATRDGSFPWSGAFKRGDKNTLGYDETVITTPESYSSTIDVKVVDKAAYSTKALQLPEGGEAQPEVYSEAIKKQLEDDNFAVKVPSYEGGNDNGGGEEPIPSSMVPEQPSSVVPEQPSSMAPEVPQPTSVIPEADPVTVTVTKTVTDPAASETSCTPTSTQTVTELETQVTTIWADAPVTSAQSVSVPTTMITSTRSSTSSGYAPTPSALAKRDISWNGTASFPVPGRAFVSRPRAVRV